MAVLAAVSIRTLKLSGLAAESVSVKVALPVPLFPSITVMSFTEIVGNAQGQSFQAQLKGILFDEGGQLIHGVGFSPLRARSMIASCVWVGQIARQGSGSFARTTPDENDARNLAGMLSRFFASSECS